MIRNITCSLFLFLLPFVLYAQDTKFSPQVSKFILYNEPVIALTHANVIDGTGSPAKAGQTLKLLHPVVPLHHQVHLMQ